MSNLRTALNSIAHKRAREVARKKRVEKVKTGTAIQAEFRQSRGRSA